jgi:hypothetical protein
MTKTELVALVTRINTLWGPPPDTDPKDQLATWWHYLADLDTTAVNHALDALVTANHPWRPRVGDLRVRAIDTHHNWPDADTAYALAQDARYRADHGLAPHGDPTILTAIGAALRLPGAHSKAGFAAA